MFISIIIYILICLFLVGLCFYVIIENKNSPNFSHNIDELYEIFFTHKEKYVFMFLHISKSNEKILLLNANKYKKIFCQKYLYSKIDFLLALSKFIDYKINSNKQMYRAKNNKILIEEIASVVASSVFKSNKCNLFSLYKKLNRAYSLKIKENKVFKLLLGKHLIYNLFEIEQEIIDISKIILRSKSVNKLRKYKKKIYEQAEIYSIKKYNPNANKILAKYKFDYKQIAKLLFIELKETEEKEKIIISYLIAMFS